jgi:hypothetical protein
MLFDLGKIEGLPVGKILEILTETEEDVVAIAKGRSRRQSDQKYERGLPEFHVKGYLNPRLKSNQ